MAAVLAPARLVREVLYCCVLGVFAGAARVLLPARGRAAFLPDALLVGSLLVLLQSYAAGASETGELRWYMCIGGALGALAAYGLLNVPLRAARRALARLIAAMAHFLHQKALFPALEWHRVRMRQAKERRDEKKTAKKWKKNLQKQEHLLYNSNV